MRKFVLGFVLGAILASVITAYAATRIVLVNGGGNAIGTASNPLYVTQ